MGGPLSTWLESTRVWAETELDRFLPPEDAHPTLLHRAMRYAVFGGGKRLRPAVVRLVCQDFGGDDAAAARPAVAIELVHTYSLVHDDLPCMDDDELRRGRPTVHVAFDEATAVLAGDALHALGFEVVAEAPPPAGAALAAVLARAAGSTGLVGGQVLDLNPDDASGGADVEAVADVHARKTGALFACAAEMGAIAAGAGPAERGAAGAFGRALGLCFQAVDDVLDATGDARTLGKTPGRDAANQRGSLVGRLGIEGARAQAERWAEAARGAARGLGSPAAARAAELVDLVLRRRA